MRLQASRGRGHETEIDEFMDVEPGLEEAELMLEFDIPLQCGDIRHAVRGAVVVLAGEYPACELVGRLFGSFLNQGHGFSAGRAR